LSSLLRDPVAAEGRTYDLVVVGGGIYGAMVALEATRRGRVPLLLEAADFGGATSHNNLRIVHGGLRYLQSADLLRFYESVAERRWFLEFMPEFVSALPCLMPLDGRGPRRRWLMGPALAANDLFSIHRNRAVKVGDRLPAGGLISVDAVRRSFPGVNGDGLRGGALWYDAFAPDMHRLIIELLRWAGHQGATCLNYMRVDGLKLDDGRVVGVDATDETSGRKHSFESECVINAAGPWSRLFSQAAGDDRVELFAGALAWNVLYDRPALSLESAIAVAPPRPGGQVLFAVPWHGRLLVGTGHAAFAGQPGDECVPGVDLLEAFTRDLNEAVPELGLGMADVARVFSGLLPTTAPGESDLTHREVLIDHGRNGGPKGLHSVSGIKFTTARRVADKLLARAVPGPAPVPWPSFERPGVRSPGGAFVDRPWGWRPDPGDSSWLEPLRRIAEEESVVHLDDLLLRRTGLADEPQRGLELAPQVAAHLGWSAAEAQSEQARVRDQLLRGVPSQR